jgi:hypothetical protein
MTPPNSARTTTGPHFDEMDGVALTGHEIYRRVHAGPGAASLTVASDAVEALARRYEQRATRITALSDKMNAAWQGSASDTAQSGMPVLVRLHQDSQKVLETVRTALGQQAGHYGETRGKLENIPETKPVNRMYNPDELSADVAQAAADYNAKAHYNVVVYDQYVAQSYTNGRAMGDTPYPAVSTTALPSITVRSSAGPEASGWSSGPGFGSSANAASPGGGGVDVPSAESRPSTTLPEVGSGAVPPGSQSLPGGSNPVIPPPTVNTVTAQQGWGPDPSLARQWIAEGAGAGQQPSLSVVKEPDGQGSAALGGNGRNPGAPDRDGRRPGIGPRVGAGDHVVSRSVLRGAPSAGAGASGLGNGMWGSPTSSGNDDDTEHKSKLDGYVDLDKLFAVDEPVFPSVIGAKNDENDENDT